jgi:hypothetical protein
MRVRGLGNAGSNVFKCLARSPLPGISLRHNTARSGLDTMNIRRHTQQQQQQQQLHQNDREPGCKTLAAVPVGGVLHNPDLRILIALDACAAAEDKGFGSSQDYLRSRLTLNRLDLILNSHKNSHKLENLMRRNIDLNDEEGCRLVAETEVQLLELVV